MNRSRALTVFIYVLAAIMVTAVVTSGVVSAITLQAVRTSQLDGTPIGRQLLAAADATLDCTRPGGKCATERDKRTAKAVALLDRGSRANAAAAAFCAAQPDVVGFDEILACMNGTLKPKVKR